MSESVPTPGGLPPDIDGILANPATSIALKAVVQAWLARDCVDAAHDARMLCALFEARADRAMGRGG